MLEGRVGQQQEEDSVDVHDVFVGLSFVDQGDEESSELQRTEQMVTSNSSTVRKMFEKKLCPSSRCSYDCLEDFHSNEARLTNDRGPRSFHDHAELRGPRSFVRRLFEHQAGRFWCRFVSRGGGLRVALDGLHHIFGVFGNVVSVAQVLDLLYGFLLLIGDHGQRVDEKVGRVVVGRAMQVLPQINISRLISSLKCLKGMCWHFFERFLKKIPSHVVRYPLH